MKNLLIVIQTGTFGGPHNQVCKMNSLLRDAGWKQSVVLPNDTEQQTLDRFAEEEIDVKLISIPRLRKTLNLGIHFKFLFGFKRVVAELEDIIDESSADLVQICGLMSLHGGFAAKNKEIPVVWQLLSTFAPKPLRAILTKLVCSQADVVMSTGVVTAEAHPGSRDFKDRLVPFFPPVVTKNYNFSESKRLKGKSLLGCRADSLVVGTVGNQNRQKNHSLFVEIASDFLSDENINFRIIGRSSSAQAESYSRSVLEPIERLGLDGADKLTVVEPIGGIEDYLAGFDVFLLTSIAEGVPTAVLEAMAAGIPVVATQVGGLVEVVESGVTGFLNDSGDRRGLSKNLRTLLTDENLRECFGVSCSKRARRDFDISCCFSAHEKAYKMALDGRKGL